MKKKFGMKGTPFSRLLASLKDEKPAKVIINKNKKWFLATLSYRVAFLYVKCFIYSKYHLTKTAFYIYNI